jgi:hypothetical protein
MQNNNKDCDSVTRDINNAENIFLNKKMKDNYDHNYYFTRTYFNSNEDIYNYLKYMPVKNSRVLSVCSSGDQAFNCISLGAKKVNTFDNNACSYYVLEYKKASILSLKYQEYLDFFPINFNNDATSYNPLTYQKIRPFLSSKAMIFWDYFYEKYRNFFPSMMPRLAYGFINKIPNYYLLNKHNYNSLKTSLANSSVTFSLIDLANIKKSSLGKYNYYDVILLSNIFDYMLDFIDMNNDQLANEFLKDNIKPLLTNTGMCLAYYSFDRDFEILNNLQHIRLLGMHDAVLMRKI